MLRTTSPEQTLFQLICSQASEHLTKDIAGLRKGIDAAGVALASFKTHLDSERGTGESECKERGSVTEAAQDIGKGHFGLEDIRHKDQLLADSSKTAFEWA